MTFSVDWLSLREPVDEAARSTSLTGSLARALTTHAPASSPLRVLDLGAGTGANLRYLAERLGAPRQAWRLVDHDAGLLDALPGRLHAWAASRALSVTRTADRTGPGIDIHGDGLHWRLSTSVRHLGLTGAADDLVDGHHLVTASALLDLVSAEWFEAVAAQCRRDGAHVLFALNYDGRVQCTPEDPDDELVRTLVNRHQQTDKGLGTAMGPEAAPRALQCLAAAGYAVWSAPSDWVLNARHSTLQAALVGGWIEAAAAIAPEQDARVRAWGRRRTTHIDDGRSTIVVGHTDIAASPPGAPVR